MTAEVLVATQLEKLNNDLSAIQRGLNERAALCREIAGKYLAHGNVAMAENWQRAAEEAQGREELSRQLAEAEWLHPEAESEAAE